MTTEEFLRNKITPKEFLETPKKKTVLPQDFLGKSCTRKFLYKSAYMFNSSIRWIFSALFPFTDRLLHLHITSIAHHPGAIAPLKRIVKMWLLAIYNKFVGFNSFFAKLGQCGLFGPRMSNCDATFTRRRHSRSNFKALNFLIFALRFPT